jgi:hypothetical protein
MSKTGSKWARWCSSLNPELRRAVDGLERVRSAGHRVADEVTGKALLTALGLRVPAAQVVSSPDEAVPAAGRVGLPVAVKLVCPDVPHKSELGAVEGPLSSPAAVDEASKRIWIRRPDAASGLLVERWHEGTPLCVVGLTMHSSFGPIVGFGLGGVWVEKLRDVSFRLAPVSHEEGLGMIHRLRGAALIIDAPRRSRLEVDRLADTIRCISRLACERALTDLIAELDINPVCLDSDGPPIALDCSVVLAGHV